MKSICIEAEEQSYENWRGQGTPSSSKPKNRSTKSYLNKQSDFEYVDFNNKWLIKDIVHLKNGNTLHHKPIAVPGIGKLLFSNTCSADSILTILACSTADSKKYKKNIYKF